MATCNPSELVQAGKCFLGLPGPQLQSIMLALLCRILQQNDAMASCDPATLMADAKCFVGLPMPQQLAIQTQLLCEILNGGGTGTTCLLCGVGAPVNNAPCDCSIYYSLPPNSGVWVWDSVNSVWDELIAPGP